MNIRHLEAFVEVVDRKSFSRAAEEMNISQPSVSFAVSSLENMLETQLIYRTTKNMIPTSSGKILYKSAKIIINQIETAKQEIYKESNPDIDIEIEGKVDLIASTMPSNYLVPKLIKAFREKQPGIEFDLKKGDTAQVEAAVAEHRADIGFVGYNHNDPRCDYIPVFKEKLVLVIAESQPQPHSLEDLVENMDFLAREKGSATREIYEDFFKDHGIAPESLNTIATFDDTHSTVSAVASNLGFAMVSEFAASIYLKSKILKIVDFTEISNAQERKDMPERKDAQERQDAPEGQDAQERRDMPERLKAPEMPERWLYLIKKKGLKLSAANQLFVDYIASSYQQA